MMPEEKGCCRLSVSFEFLFGGVMVITVLIH